MIRRHTTKTSGLEISAIHPKPPVPPFPGRQTRRLKRRWRRVFWGLLTALWLGLALIFLNVHSCDRLTCPNVAAAPTRPVAIVFGFLGRKLGLDVVGVDAAKRAYGGQLGFDLREIAATEVAWVQATVTHPRPKFLGKPEPLFVRGEASHHASGPT